MTSQSARLVTIFGISLLLTGAAQERDIEVVGKRDVVPSGLWRVEERPEQILGAVGGQRSTSERRWEVCLASPVSNDDVFDMLRVNQQNGVVGGCLKAKLSIRNTNFRGNVTCNNGRLSMERQLIGRVYKDFISLKTIRTSSTSKGVEVKGSGRIEAVRSGDCPLTNYAIEILDDPVRSQIAHTVPPVTQPDPVAETPVSMARALPQITAGVALPRHVKLHADDEQDIEVVGKRYGILRLLFNRVGRTVRHCSIIQKSGDATVDLMGCSVLRACVSDGYVATIEAVVCVNRAIDRRMPPRHPHSDKRTP